jgi:acetylornithine deacetylase/succinyl-diaminopimelate desuccinylase-like protein
MTTTAGIRDEVTQLLRRLIVCDTSNPPGRETQAAAILEDYLQAAGIDCQRVAKDGERANLVARLPGTGAGPSLAFLGHLDVVQARRQDWSVEPFAAVVKDDAVWGRGAIDMKCQVAATSVALATLARGGFRPAGDILLVFMADEEVGEAGDGAPFLVEEMPHLCPSYVIGEGAGERIPTPDGPIYVLDHGVKESATATVTVRGVAGDASLPGTGRSAAFELSRLLGHLAEYRSPVRVVPEVRPLLDAVVPEGGSDADRVAAARRLHPALDRILGALTGTVLQPTLLEAAGPANVVPELATITIQCILLPGTSDDDLVAELRAALGDGDYDLDVTKPKGGLVSPLETPLHRAIEQFLAEQDPDARLVPALGYGFSDCHLLREAYDATVYGFIPFRHADPMTNYTTKHGADERVLIDDLVFQTHAAMSVAQQIGTP